MSYPQISPGDLVECLDAGGELHWMHALSKPERGHKFPIVWVCTDADWRLAAADRTKANNFRPVPWPLDAIRAIRRAGNPEGKGNE